MVTKTKNKLKELGFGTGHYGMIAFCLLAVAMMSFIKGPLTLENLFKLQFTSADIQTEIEISVQDAILQAESDVPPVAYDANEKIAAYKKEQLALLDPYFGGKVLGVSTEAQTSIDNILSNQNVNQIPVKQVSDSTKSITEYSSRSKVIESYYGALELLSILSTQDKATAAKTIPYYQNIIAELQNLETPQSFARFHRVKLLYYTTLMTMASNIASDSSSADRSAAGILFFEIGNELESLKLQLNQEMGVVL